VPRSLMLKAAAAVGAAGLLTVAGCGSAAGGGATGKAPLSIAGVVAFTGSSDFESQSNEGGVYPAIYAINHAGGVMGHMLRYQPVDTKADPADALPAMQQAQATTSNLILVAGPDTSSAPALVPLLNNAKIPMTAVAGESVYDRNKLPYFWRLFPPDSANGTAMALWAKRKGYMRVATVFGTDSGSQGDLPGVVASLKALRLNLAAQVNITPDQSSYEASVRQVMAAHPQVIMTEADATTSATFLGELKQLGGLVPVIGTEATFTAPWLKAVQGVLGSAFQKDYTGLITAPSKATGAVTAYQKAVTAVQAKEPKPWQSYLSNPFSLTYYDGVLVVALAMDAARSTDPAVFNKYIPQVANPGRGKTIVYTYPQGVAALKAGKKIEYYGATGLINFNSYHNSFGNQEAVASNGSSQPVGLGTVTASQIEAVPVTGVA